jgi:hypothetical protein
MERLARGLSNVLHWVGQCDAHCKLSYVVVADLSTRQGLLLVKQALQRLQQHKAGVRMAFAFRSAQKQSVRELASELLARLQVCVATLLIAALNDLI